MSDDNIPKIIGIAVLMIFLIGAVVGSVFAEWQNHYVSDITVAKFHVAENITTNMTIKEKTNIIKQACDSYYDRDLCYSRLYDEFINPELQILNKP